MGDGINILVHRIGKLEDYKRYSKFRNPEHISTRTFIPKKGFIIKISNTEAQTFDENEAVQSRIRKQILAVSGPGRYDLRFCWGGVGGASKTQKIRHRLGKKQGHAKKKCGYPRLAILDVYDEDSEGWFW